MQGQLGLTLRPETLPLSLANAYLPPAWLSPEMVCALAYSPVLGNPDPRHSS